MIKFNGRPYGIGNKLEEIFILEAYCIRNRTNAQYFWNNKDPKFSYPVMIDCDHILIQEHLELSGNPDIPGFYNPGFITRDEMKLAVKHVHFKINFPKICDLPYVGIHIRRGDRIPINWGGISVEDYMTDELAESLFLKTIDLVNKESPSNLFVCSDDMEYKNRFISSLNKSINVIQIEHTDPALVVYQDFLALAGSTHIYMCSKYSSFSATASLINDIPLYTFFKPEESSLARNNVKFVLLT